MIRSLLVTLLLLTFLIQESDFRILPVMETSAEVELIEVAEKFISNHKIQFKKSIENPSTILSIGVQAPLVFNDPISPQILFSLVRRNILLMQFLI